MTENKKKLNAADLASLLRSKINLGQYVRNDKLPTERDMADTYGVSRGTVREALTKLMENGLVEIKHGSGTYVCKCEFVPLTVPLRKRMLQGVSGY